MKTLKSALLSTLGVYGLSFLVLVSQFSIATAQVNVGPTGGVSFTQIDFPYDNDPITDTSVGSIDVDIPTLRQSTGMESGFVNVDVNGEWIVQNLPVFPAADYSPEAISADFDLGVTPGTDVSMFDAAVGFSSNPLASFTPGTPSTFSVGSSDVVIGGAEAGAGGPPPAEPSRTSVAFDPNGITMHGGSPEGIPNIEAAKNQCVPASFANSLQMLENTTGLTMAPENVMGLKGDNSAVGLLDTAINRSAPDRRHGGGVYEVTAGIPGKLKFLLQNGMQDVVKTTHQSRMNTDRNSESATANGKTLTSERTGNKVSIGDMIDARQKGKDVELTYGWPGGAHNVVLVRAGMILGQPYIIHSSDLNQNDDTKGAGSAGLKFEWLVDPDNDGHWNFASDTSKEIRTMICEEYIPPITTMLNLTCTRTWGDLSHLCCINSPGSYLYFTCQGSTITFADSESYFPFTGSITDHSFSASSTGTVASYSNVQSTFIGSIIDSSAFATCPSILRSSENSERSLLASESDNLVMQGTIKVGTNGALPGGQSLNFDVDLTLPPGDTTTIATDTTIETGETLTVEPGESLVVSSGNTLTVNGILDNDSSNTITIENGAALEINGIFDNDGAVDNYGTITINQGAFLENDGTITNAAGAAIDNDGTITNDVDGTIDNNGTIDSGATAFMFNEGTIFNGCDGVINGTITGNAAESNCLIPFSIASIDTDLQAPPAVGSDVKITILTTRTQTNLHYRWFANTVPFGAWQPLADWTLFNDNETWSPAAANRYVVLAHAAEVGETTNFHQGGFIIETQGSSANPIQILDVTTDIDYPQAVGTPITLNATASGGSGGPLYFKYFYRLRMGGWTALSQDWNEDGNGIWSPQEEGVYTLVVHVSENNTAASNPLNQAGMTVTIGE